MAYMATFDATPCIGSTIDDLDVEAIKTSYLPSVVSSEELAADQRDIKEQLASVRLFDRKFDCPTYAAIILFGKRPRFFLPGCYVQFVRFSGKDKSGEILNEREFQGALYKMLPQLESFMRDAIVTQRPVTASLLREKTVINYPDGALRELLMNACMHRDYQSNMPIRLYQYDDRVEIMNAGGLYGEARPENFPGVNDYRNPVVAEAMKGLKYVNMFNRGVTRVQNMLEENGNPKPEFDVSKLTAFEVRVLSTIDENQVSNQVTDQVLSLLDMESVIKILTVVQSAPHSKKEILTQTLKKTSHFYNYMKFIAPLVENGLLEATIKDKPNSPKQKYKITELGISYLKYLKESKLKA